LGLVETNEVDDEDEEGHAEEDGEDDELQAMET
jgi:hypothetical protein